MRDRGYGLRVSAETAFGALASCVALGAAARAQGSGWWQPLNATSHWLNGDGVARRRGLSWRATAVGFATHTAATAFWAAIFEGWLAASSRRRGGELGKAAAMAGLAALVDYTVTPKRLTPGWELVLRPRGLAAAYLAMAAGFAAAARLSCRRS